MSQLLPSTVPIPGGIGPSNQGSGAPSALQSRDRRSAEEALQRAHEILADGGITRLLSTSDDRWEVERPRQIFVNRNLRFDRIELVGFDMDYTLAVYHMRRIEQLSFDMTLAKLISEYGYPAEIGLLHYDHQFGMRGLVVDKTNGNVIKMDRFGHVGRAYHGRSPLSDEVWTRLYRNEMIRLKNPQYAWIDTLFALPEACIFAGVIELLEARGHTLNYARLYEDIREAIDVVHRDNSLKREIRKDIGHYIFKDLELGSTLHKLRSSGKKLFLLTNSMWDYTDAVMKYLLQDALAEYPSWRNYFDFVITGASKPGFFSQSNPFLVLDPSIRADRAGKAGEEGRVLGEAQSLERWKVYQGGNLTAFERMAGFSGNTVLYVGDHIYGDILKSKKSSLWRTCMIVQELEDEIAYTDGRKAEIEALSDVELLRGRLEDEVSHRKSQLNAADRRLEKNPAPEEQKVLEEDRKRLKGELDLVRRARKETFGIAEAIERAVEHGFNPFWGLLFKEGSENSRFGEQVEQYACLYTGRVSNFLHYSSTQYFHSPREQMPHEQAGALSGKLSPIGSEGPPPGSRND